MGEIYKITNKLNGKKYIGQTIRGAEDRFLEHCKPRKGKKISYIQRAIQKHGKDNFSFEVIYRTKNLNLMERYFIKLENSSFPNGYNLTLGGEGGKKTEEAKKNIGLSAKGRPSPKKGIKTGPLKFKRKPYSSRPKQSSETIEKRMSKIRGRKASLETRKKLSLSHIGKVNESILVAIELTNKKTGIGICFKSTADAARYGFNGSAIRNVICGISNSLRDYNVKRIQRK
jgi:group I intron endonuclease